MVIYLFQIIIGGIMSGTFDNETTKETYHDFFMFNKWLFFSLGYSDTGNRAYFYYKVMLYIMHGFTLILVLTGIYLVIPDKISIINCIPLFILSLYCNWVMSARLMNNGPLQRMRKSSYNGFYVYENEKESETQILFKENAVKKIKSSSTSILVALFTGSGSMFFVLPLSQLYFLGTVDTSGQVLNPYLPTPLYIPFDTRSHIGYICGMLLNAQLLYFAYGNAICATQIYISCSLQLNAQFKILNYSIRNIESRAREMYFKSSIYDHKIAIEVPDYDKNAFQNCLILCLLANVQHHQLLLRYLYY